jgi:hypothetical protein
LNLTELAERVLAYHSRCLGDLCIGVSAEAVTLACEHTAEDSAMRKYLIKEIASRVFLWNDNFINGAGVAASNASFNQQALEAIQNHLKASIMSVVLTAGSLLFTISTELQDGVELQLLRCQRQHWERERTD